VEEPSSFRLLCMLNSTEKLFERILLERLNEHLDRTGQRTETQYGFRSGRSTMDAIKRVMQAAHGAAQGAVRHRDICTVVSLDVCNAFNTAPWLKIDEALWNCGIPWYLNEILRSYLNDRKILVGNSQQKREVNCGVPQGSVLGPALWNILYDGLLNIQLPAGVQLVAFADDVAIVGIARTGELTGVLLNPVINRVSDWMKDNDLQLALHKTKAVVLTSKKKYAEPELFLQKQKIGIKRSIRYLGMVLDIRLSFTEHVATMSRKAMEAARAIGRLMPKGAHLRRRGVCWAQMSTV